MTDKEKLIEFFLWFRENGEKYQGYSIEVMINIYLEQKQQSNDSND